MTDLGLSPFNHRVEIINGKLSLYWTWAGREHVRAFTCEETRNLLRVLEAHKIEIEGCQEYGYTENA